MCGSYDWLGSRDESKGTNLLPMLIKEVNTIATVGFTKDMEKFLFEMRGRKLGLQTFSASNVTDEKLWQDLEELMFRY